MNNQLFIIKHKRTGMFVARQEVSRLGHSLSQIRANWKWVRDEAQADRFAENMTIHPIIQLDLEGKVDILPVAPDA